MTQKIPSITSKHEIQKLIQEAGEHIEENTEQLNPTLTLGAPES